ncbi:MAG TPA: hypothetical protein VFZ70_07065 [Euzebyales bacterium]
MRRFAVLLLAVVLTLGLSAPAFAHDAGPCNDSDGDGSFSGQEYAAHHIVALATIGGMGNDGHKPGSHQGFSLCNPSGR